MVGSQYLKTKDLARYPEIFLTFFVGRIKPWCNHLRVFLKQSWCGKILNCHLFAAVFVQLTFCAAFLRELCTWFDKLKFSFLFFSLYKKLYPPVCSTVPASLQGGMPRDCNKGSNRTKKESDFYVFEFECFIRSSSCSNK